MKMLENFKLTDILTNMTNPTVDWKWDFKNPTYFNSKESHEFHTKIEDLIALRHIIIRWLFPWQSIKSRKYVITTSLNYLWDKPNFYNQHHKATNCRYLSQLSNSNRNLAIYLPAGYQTNHNKIPDIIDNLVQNLLEHIHPVSETSPILLTFIKYTVFSYQ